MDRPVQDELFLHYCRERIHHSILTDSAMCYWAFMNIMSQQTPDEIATGTTIHFNTIGIDKMDAEFYTDLYKKFRVRNTFSMSQITALRKTLIKYTYQLVRLAKPHKLEALYRKDYQIAMVAKNPWAD